VTQGRATSALFPLSAAYARVGLQTPKAMPLASSRIPSPYRSLLLHDGNMTSTLEAHFGGSLTLRALCAFTEGSSYFRRVVLVQKSLGRPVVMGAIRLDLAAFPPGIRREILARRIPLGRVLRDGGLDYQSRPRRFFKVTPNSEMMAVFWMSRPRCLYGRQTELSVGGRKAGDIVEILPLV